MTPRPCSTSCARTRAHGARQGRGGCGSRRPRSATPSSDLTLLVCSRPLWARLLTETSSRGPASSVSGQAIFARDYILLQGAGRSSLWRSCVNLLVASRRPAQPRIGARLPANQRVSRFRRTAALVACPGVVLAGARAGAWCSLHPAARPHRNARQARRQVHARADGLAAPPLAASSRLAVARCRRCPLSFAVVGGLRWHGRRLAGGWLDAVMMRGSRSSWPFLSPAGLAIVAALAPAR